MSMEDVRRGRIGGLKTQQLKRERAAFDAGWRDHDRGEVDHARVAVDPQYASGVAAGRDKSKARAGLDPFSRREPEVETPLGEQLDGHGDEVES